MGEAHASTFAPLHLFHFLALMFDVQHAAAAVHSLCISASAPFHQTCELFGLMRCRPRLLRSRMRTCACSGAQPGHLDTPGHLGTLSDVAHAEFEKRQGGIFSCYSLRSRHVFKLSAAAFCGSLLQLCASTLRTGQHSLGLGKK